MGNYCIDFQRDKFCRQFLQSRGIALSPAVFDVNIPVFHITELAQFCADRIDFLDVTRSRSSPEKPDAPGLVLRLAVQLKRRTKQASAQCSHECSALNHSMTLSTRTSMDGGILTPSNPTMILRRVFIR